MKRGSVAAANSRAQASPEDDEVRVFSQTTTCRDCPTKPGTRLPLLRLSIQIMLRPSVKSDSRGLLPRRRLSGRAAAGAWEEEVRTGSAVFQSRRNLCIEAEKPSSQGKFLFHALINTEKTALGH